MHSLLLYVTPTKLSSCIFLHTLQNCKSLNSFCMYSLLWLNLLLYPHTPHPTPIPTPYWNLSFQGFSIFTFNLSTFYYLYTLMVCSKWSFSSLLVSICTQVKHKAKELKLRSIYEREHVTFVFLGICSLIQQYSCFPFRPSVGFRVHFPSQLDNSRKL